MNRQQKITLFLLIVIYAFNLVNFSIALPVFTPMLLGHSYEFFNTSAEISSRLIILGLVFGVYGIGQLIFSPIFGWFGDRFGRKKALLYSITGDILANCILIIAIILDSLPLLFIGRFCTGVIAGNMVLTYSICADMSTEQNRSKYFGYLAGAGGLGYLFGPWIGGRLALFHMFEGSTPFILMVIINILLLFFTYQYLVETLTEKNHLDVKLLKPEYINIFKSRAILQLYLCYLLFCFGWNFFLQFLSPYLFLSFDLTSAFIGDIYAYLTAIWAISSFLINAYIHNKTSNWLLAIISQVLTGICLALSPLAKDLLWGIFFLTLIPLFGGIFYPNFLTLLSIRFPSRRQGQVIGFNQSLYALGQTSSAVIAGFLSTITPWLPITVGGITILFGAVFLISWKR